MPRTGQPRGETVAKPVSVAALAEKASSKSRFWQQCGHGAGHSLVTSILSSAERTP
jgi:hypothetical protein